MRLRLGDAAGFRDAWTVIEDLWGPTVERARRLPEAWLSERVDGEWSFTETLRHLAFAADAWVPRIVRGDAEPYHRVALPHDEFGDPATLGLEVDAPWTFDEVMAARRDCLATVRTMIDGLTDDDLDRPRPQNPRRATGTRRPSCPRSVCGSSSTRNGGTIASPSATSRCSKRSNDTLWTPAEYLDEEGWAAVDDLEIVHRINDLADEEHALERAHAGEALSGGELDRLRAIEVALDQCWDLLRQRRARRRAGEDPDDAEARPPEIVERYQQ